MKEIYLTQDELSTIESVLFFAQDVGDHCICEGTQSDKCLNCAARDALDILEEAEDRAKG